MNKNKYYPISSRKTEGDIAKKIALENPGRDERMATPLDEIPVYDNKVEAGWYAQALMVIITGIQEALDDDGKISLSEAFNIVLSLLELVPQLLTGKR